MAPPSNPIDPQGHLAGTGSPDFGGSRWFKYDTTRGAFIGQHVPTNEAGFKEIQRIVFQKLMDIHS